MQLRAETYFTLLRFDVVDKKKLFLSMGSVDVEHLNVLPQVTLDSVSVMCL